MLSSHAPVSAREQRTISFGLIRQTWGRHVGEPMKTGNPVKAAAGIFVAAGDTIDQWTAQLTGETLPELTGGSLERTKRDVVVIGRQCLGAVTDLFRQPSNVPKRLLSAGLGGIRLVLGDIPADMANASGIGSTAGKTARIMRENARAVLAVT